MPKPLYDALARLAALRGLTSPAIILAAHRQRPRPILYWSNDR